MFSLSSINVIAVLGAAVAAFVIGFLFHGPLFGKVWMKLADVKMTGNEKLSDMFPQMIGNFIVNFVTAYFLAVVYFFVSSSAAWTAHGVWGGVLCGLLVWIGFLVTSSSIAVIWMGQKKSLWFFECVSSAIVMAVMGAIIAVWA